MRTEPKILVAIRKRPLLKRDISKNDPDIVEIKSEKELVVKELRAKLDLTPYIEEHRFTFDATFDESSNNYHIYEVLLKPLVASAFDNAKINVFAYGQTGSGKTFTMMGNPEAGIPGLYLLAIEDLFSQLLRYQDLEQTLGISFYEIYCGKAYDLLNERNPCFIRVDAKDNVHIVGLNETRVSNKESLMALIRYGLSARITGTTGANEESSRSHAILSISLRQIGTMKLAGKISFIDLAGSERGADVTDSIKHTRIDGAEINKSLLALKECIRALDQDKKYLPFRGSKLTMVLKDSFVGNSVTVMIGNISPMVSACEHTLNTLRYADRVKELRRGNAPRESKDSRDLLARSLMLPRMAKNSERINIPERVVEDNLVIEHFDIKNSVYGDNIKSIYQHHNKIKHHRPSDSVNKRQPSLQPSRPYQKSRNSSLARDLVASDDSTPQRMSSQKKDPMISSFTRVNDRFSKKVQQPLPEKQEKQNVNRLTAEELLNYLSNQQEEVIDEHSNHIDALVACVKEDMSFLQEAKDSPTEVLDYIHKTKELLGKKMESILRFQKILQKFEDDYQTLEEEGVKESSEEVFSLQKEDYSNSNLLM